MNAVDGAFLDDAFLRAITLRFDELERRLTRLEKHPTGDVHYHLSRQDMERISVPMPAGDYAFSSDTEFLIGA